MRLPALIIASAALVCSVGWGISSWRSHVRERGYATILRSVGDLHAAGETPAALAILDENRALLDRLEAKQVKTQQVELDLVTTTRDIGRLANLARTNRDLVAGDEKASLLWARVCLHSRDVENFDEIRGLWAGREVEEASWFFLDTDRLILSGETQAAREFVSAKAFQGPPEARRLVYMALFDAHQPGEALRLLEKAYREDPRNSDVRGFAADLFESAGYHEIAQREYVAAYYINPENAVSRDNLAEFYLRRGNMTQALATWDDPHPGGVPGFIWIKHFFWSRMCLPQRALALPPTSDPSGIHAWAKAAAELPEGRYWSELLDDKSSALGEGAGGLEKYFFWLRLVDQLALQREDEARALLRVAPDGTDELAPALANALRTLLVFRSTGRLPDSPVAERDQRPANSPHQFFRQLTAREIEGSTDGFRQFLSGPNAIVSTFLAASWLNVASGMHGQNSGFEPDWFDYAMAQAFRYTRGNQVAISYLESARPTATNAVLLGELLVGEDDLARGIDVLRSVATDPSDAGYRATWLLALTLVATDHLDEARVVVMSHPRFAESQTGVEVLARIALGRGKISEAQSLYRRIVGPSLEAKMFFAREAYAEEDWEEAKHLILGAIELQPNQEKLRENLKRIELAAGSPDHGAG